MIVMECLCLPVVPSMNSPMLVSQQGRKAKDLFWKSWVFPARVVFNTSVSLPYPRWAMSPAQEKHCPSLHLVCILCVTPAPILLPQRCTMFKYNKKENLKISLHTVGTQQLSYPLSHMWIKAVMVCLNNNSRCFSPLGITVPWDPHNTPSSGFGCVT